MANDKDYMVEARGLKDEENPKSENTIDDRSKLLKCLMCWHRDEVVSQPPPHRYPPLGYQRPPSCPQVARRL